MGKCASQTTLEVFLEMEHMDLISQTNLNFLEGIVKLVSPVLAEKIRKFKAQNCELQKIKRHL